MECVFRASSVEQADIVVAWLAEQGIDAFVKNRNMAANYVALAVAPRGIEVCVTDPQQAQQAEALLEEHSRTIERRRTQTPDKVLPMSCPGCGRRVEFPGELSGTVQSCPGCGQNIDVGESPRYC